MAVKSSEESLAAYDAKTAHLSYGDMSYADKGKGEVILSVHGIFGGYDQACNTCEDFNTDYRIIAPSRFGYLGSDVLGNGTPAFLCNDYAIFLISLLFKPIMGMEPSTIYSMLPVRDRKDGVILDSSITNPEMASYTDTEKAISRFPNCTFISFESGGHLLSGHGKEIKKAVSEFISK